MGFPVLLLSWAPSKRRACAMAFCSSDYSREVVFFSFFLRDHRPPLLRKGGRYLAVLGNNRPVEWPSFPGKGLTPGDRLLEMKLGLGRECDQVH